MANTPYKIINLGDVGWTDLNDAFKNNTSLEAVTIGAGINQLAEMINTFNGCYNLTEIDVVDWDISNITSLKNFLKGCKLGTVSYSSMLVHFADSTHINVGVVMHGGDSFYNTDGQDARDTLVNVYQWVIEDGGLQPEWLQILTTDEYGNMIDLVSTTQIPELINKRCVQLFDKDYIETNVVVPTFRYNAIDDEFMLTFDMEIYSSSSTQYILGNRIAGTQGISVYLVSGIIYLMVSENDAQRKFVMSSIAIPINTMLNVSIYKVSGNSNIFLKLNDTVYTWALSTSWSGTYAECTNTFLIGRDPDNVSDFYTGKIGNVHWHGELYLPLEEKYGLNCCNTIIGEAGVVQGDLIALSDSAAIRTTFTRSSEEPSYGWKMGYNKVDEFTTAPSLYNKTLGKFQIDSAESYAMTETPYQMYTSDAYAMEVEFTVYDNQEAADSVICSLGDPRTTSLFISIRYNGSSVYVRWNNTNMTSTAISTNKKYKMKVKLALGGGYPGYYTIKYYLYDSDDVQVAYISTYYWSSSARPDNTYTNFYIGQPPIPAALNIPQDSCLCNIDSVTCTGCVDDANKFVYTTQVETLYTLSDLYGNGLDAVISPVGDIFNSWTRSLNEQDGVYVDCIEHNEIQYPACKDGILHNGDEVDFKQYYTTAKLKNVEWSETYFQAIAGTYVHTGTYNSRPYYKHITESAYLFYHTTDYRWRIMSDLGNGGGSGVVSKYDSLYPPRVNWANSSLSYWPIISNTLAYDNTLINDSGNFDSWTFSDMLAFTRDDDIITESHITDTGVTVITKVQTIDPV